MVIINSCYCIWCFMSRNPLSLYEMPERFYRYMVCGVHASY